MVRIAYAAIGIGVCVLAGAFAVPGIGSANAVVFSFLLTYVLALTAGMMVVLAFIMRPPFSGWKALMPAVFCFLPMFLGWFPVSGWLTELGRELSWQGLPSYNWILAAMALGVLCPDGAILKSKRVQPNDSLPGGPPSGGSSRGQ
ncbi:MAG: hypothetical protein HZC36_13050 [Armatimonadetes bacterium]|nr:hypothetical protein [Armatimonadota bacterium]